MVRSRYWVKKFFVFFLCGMPLSLYVLLLFFFFSAETGCKTVTSHYLHSSLACPLLFMFESLICGQWKAHTFVIKHTHTHTCARAKQSCAACEGWLSRWCITGQSVSASSLWGPLRQSASTNHSFPQSPRSTWLAAVDEPQTLHTQLASLSTNNHHKRKRKAIWWILNKFYR